MPKRKVSKASVYNKKKERLLEQMFNEGRPWTNEMNDELLDGYLLHEWFYQSKRDCFLSKCGRSVEAIQSQLWKLAVRYPRPGILNYRPQNRLARTLQFKGIVPKLTYREMALLELATSPVGRANRACEASWLEVLLNIPWYTLGNFLLDVERRSPMFVKTALKGENEDQRVGRIVHETIKGRYFEASMSTLDTPRSHI